jgi:hypothetical protein
VYVIFPYLVSVVRVINKQLDSRRPGSMPDR